MSLEKIEARDREAAGGGDELEHLLREIGPNSCRQVPSVVIKTCEQAADRIAADRARIKALEAENARLREALVTVAKHFEMLVKIGDGRLWAVDGEKPTRATTNTVWREEAQAGANFTRAALAGPAASREQG